MGVVWTFLLSSIFFLSLSLWETARYRLKCCLKGPLHTKQPTNQPDINWLPYEIARTHRIGTKIEIQNEDDEDTSNDKPSIFLIKFHQWDKKMILFKGREILRDVGIRIGDNLTRRQRHALQRLAQQSKFSYFY